MNHTTHPVEHEEVMAWVDGQLEVARAAEVAAHVEQCAECQAVAADLRRASQHMAAWQVEPAPASVAETVLAAAPAEREVRPAAKERRSWFFRWGWQLATGFAVLLIVVAIGTPNLMRSRMAANEASVVGSLRTINTACATYSSTYGGFPQRLSQLGGPGGSSSKNGANLMDNVLASGRKSGYRFIYVPGGIDARGNVLEYSVSAQPETPGTNGVRYFFTDQTGVIRANIDGPAYAGSRPISGSDQGFSDRAVDTALVEGESNLVGSGAVATSTRPMIVRTASLTIFTKEFANTRAAVEQVVRKHGGYIAQLSVTGQAASSKALNATLRIPVEKLDAALGELKKLGRVQTESLSGEEVTKQHTDLVARQESARKTEKRLTQVLENRTGKVADVLSVEQEIARVREEIEKMEAERKGLENQVAYATVQLQLQEEYEAQINPPQESAWLLMRNAAVEGVRSLRETALGLALFLLGYGPPLLFWALVLFWPARIIWRRLRHVVASQ